MGKQCTQLCIGMDKLNSSCVGFIKDTNLTTYLPAQFRVCSHAILMSFDMTVTSVNAEIADTYQL